MTTTTKQKYIELLKDIENKRSILSKLMVKDLTLKEEIFLLNTLLRTQKVLFEIFNLFEFAHFDNNHRIAELIEYQTPTHYKNQIDMVSKWLKELINE